VYINKINQTVRSGSGSGGGKTVLFLLLRAFRLETLD
jgi:hypothetical protein